MKGDFTRSTFDHKKHYSSVRMQQGRVQLDSDWNEQVDIQTYLLEQRTEDVVGQCGAPIHNAGFAINPIEDGKKLTIGRGHYYVEGILCENVCENEKEECEFTEQDDLPNIELPTEPGNYLFYLDVWQRHITAVDDDDIREVALGGPDTATRTKTVWQVKRLKLDEALDKNSCIQEFGAWNDLTSARNSCLKADAPPEEPSEYPCIVPHGAGYRGLANHLYRVEIHKSGETGKATFKWSRENGSIVRAIEKIDDSTDTITIVNPGQDVLHAFAPYQWVEVTDDLRELTEQPGTLVRLTEVSDGVTLTFDPATAIGDAINSTNFPEEYSPRVRRWDQTESAEIEISDQRIELEHGLGVQFKTEDTYQSGDYWLIPARATTGKIEWNQENGGWQQRSGIFHHYCRLAILKHGATGGWEPIKDCRKIFPPMTEMVTLSYLSGDGQEAMPGRWLPAPLEVRVSSGEHPIEGARVRFTITRGDGSLKHEETRTDAGGLASCGWKLDEENQSQQAEATLMDVVLLDRDGNPVLDRGEEVHPSIRFNANLSLASHVAYDPEKCAYLHKGGAKTVQAAIDELCNREMVTLSYLSGDGQEAMPGRWLPAPLEVRVSSGEHPIEGARVRFTITRGDGSLKHEETRTDAGGLASCGWKLDEENQSQQAEATLMDVVLLDRDGNPVLDRGEEVHPSIRFNANLSLASHVAYDPEKCAYLHKGGAKTVQAAIDELCNREMVTLSYVSGDGQEAMPGHELPAPLEVRVSSGEHSIEDAIVQFTITRGDGSLQHEEARTDAGGLASCGWKLDEENQSQQAEATLMDVVVLDRDGNPVLDRGEEVHPSIRFNANLSLASHVAYDPRKCAYLKESGAETVQAAIDELCNREMVTLSYVSGDGQEAMPGHELPAPLEVRVSSGEHSIEGARVRFTITQGDGSLQHEVVMTDAGGLASCIWTLDEKNQSQQAEATLLDVVLLDRDGNPVLDGGKEVYPSIRFNANLSRASHVAYEGKCAYLKESGAETVQAAIDELCNREEEAEELGIHVDNVFKAGNEELGNYTEVAASELSEGLHIVCDQEVDNDTIEGKPTCYVTLYMPFPFNSADRELWGDQVLGFQPLILAADVTLDGMAICWNPTAATGSWLQQSLLGVMNDMKYGDRVLASLTLKGNFIWAVEEDHFLYLDGEAFGVPENHTESNLDLPSGNGRRGGDFEMWFWLVEKDR